MEQEVIEFEGRHVPILKLGDMVVVGGVALELARQLEEESDDVNIGMQQLSSDSNQ